MITDKTQYVNWFRHSSPYINAYRGKVFVILLPGEAIASTNFKNIVSDIALLNSLGVKLVIVHGARPQISEALQLAGLSGELHQEYQSALHNDLRITSNECLGQIKQVVGKLRIELEAMFSMGLVNSPMHGANINICSGNFIVAKPYGIHNGIDYGYTGEVRKVDSNAINRQLDTNNIVLLSNLGYSITGEVFNLTVEEVTAACAIALQADKLIVYDKHGGILDKAGTLINTLSTEQAQELIAAQISNNSSRSQLKTLELCVNASRAQVKRSQVISYLDDGALLTELFTRDGAGTLITQENYENIREANIDDVRGILALIQPLEEDGSLVHRSRELLETEIANFCVVEREGTIIACAALYPLGDNSAELACVVTHPEYRKNNRGQFILEQVQIKAQTLGINKLFVLTTKSPHWFLERGFTKSSINSLPQEKKDLYNFQRNSTILEKQL